jgi:hypothetical protein
MPMPQMFPRLKPGPDGTASLANRVDAGSFGRHGQQVEQAGSCLAAPSAQAPFFAIASAPLLRSSELHVPLILSTRPPCYTLRSHPVPVVDRWTASPQSFFPIPSSPQNDSMSRTGPNSGLCGCICGGHSFSKAMEEVRVDPSPPGGSGPGLPNPGKSGDVNARLCASPKAKRSQQGFARKRAFKRALRRAQCSDSQGTLYRGAWRSCKQLGAALQQQAPLHSLKARATQCPAC